jgi:hypothetical protein
VAFLKQRDGLDKMLKLMRYAAQLSAHHVLLRDPTSVTGAKLRNLDASTSVTRKFIRLGKFLGNAKELRVLLRANVTIVSASNSSSRDANDVARSSSSSGGGSGSGSAAAAAASAAARLGHAALLTNRLGIACQSVQLLYNFLEQGNWAVKTGLIRQGKGSARVFFEGQTPSVDKFENISTLHCAPTKTTKMPQESFPLPLSPRLYVSIRPPTSLRYHIPPTPPPTMAPEAVTLKSSVINGGNVQLLVGPSLRQRAAEGSHRPLGELDRAADIRVRRPAGVPGTKGVRAFRGRGGERAAAEEPQ